ncbi:hypothetical protein K435DRAFT_962517 [Dendrothele bispora CBS 962.96]|uniref:Family A G protein-coupled receptor-like protein n=1 Tax=Dendrothele bispora (strain CBS 962.96) TaxID=1314807 RepID=A0A4S8MKI4_DENBC|nr:hypothetical protein K435DRAFT_962517 [Dendrothele bispora CBS 962.96]
MSSTLGQQKSQPLSDSDLYIVRIWILQTAVGFLLYGVYATLSIIGLFLLMSKGLSVSSSANAKPRLALFTLTVLMLAFSTTSLVVYTLFFLFQLETAAYDPPEWDVIGLLKDLNVVGNFMDRMNYLISDGIVVWRAWIMFPHNTVARSVLAICMIGSFVGTFVDAGISSARFLRHFDDNGKKGDLLIIALPLIITNAVATGVIGWKAWSHYKNIKQNLNLSVSSISRVQKVLLLLVESGVIYCALWTTYTTISLIGSSGSVSFQVYSSAMPFMSALYPILIVLIAALENSRDDLDSKGNVRMSLSQSIRFASVAATPDASGRASGPDMMALESSSDPGSHRDTV